MIQDNAGSSTSDFRSCLQCFAQNRAFTPTDQQLPGVEEICRKRARTLDIDDLSGYVDYLEAQPGEFQHTL